MHPLFDILSKFHNYIFLVSTFTDRKHEGVYLISCTFNMPSKKLA